MNDHYCIENILVHQKDVIIALINSRQYDKARVILDFIGPFWLEVDYGYKLIELNNRLRLAMDNQ